MQQIGVILVDDHTIVRQGLRRVLELNPQLKILGEASDGEAAVELARTACPDVILMDVNMPGTNGIEASKIILQEMPQTKIIALTVSEDDQIFDLIRAGISAYLLKDVDAQELVKAIEDVYEGRSVVHPRVTARLFGELNRLATRPPVNEQLEQLTSREREVLKLIGQGDSNRDIAETLFISEKTVKNHITNILRKLGAKDRTQAAIFAIKSHLIEP
ncbi:MAG: response regulator transcription factor [Firmicutes bacterium]|nr:response regulator transcription factor [Bacillota bacterium]